MPWRFDLASEIGGRVEQQDRAAVLTVPDRRDEYLAVLADGMGGQQHGGLAAQAVIDTARQELSDTRITEPKGFLIDLCKRAHETIEQIGGQLGATPASTCTLLYLNEEEAYWVHVGDSRLYHFDGDRLLFRTRDHRVAELTMGESAFGSAPSGADPEGNGLYMCLGGKNALEPEFGATAVGKDDWLMLCSDGFWGQVEAEEVAHTLAAPRKERKTAADLAALAAQRGGASGDNASLVLAIHEISSTKSIWQRFLPSGMRFGR